MPLGERLVEIDGLAFDWAAVGDGLTALSSAGLDAALLVVLEEGMGLEGVEAEDRSTLPMGEGLSDEVILAV